MTAYYHYSREGRNTMSHDDGKYAFGVDAFGWDLTPPPEDFGYGLGWAALGETLGDHDGCEAARAMGAAIVGCEEMQAIKAVLRHHAKEYSLAKQAVGTSASKREILSAWGLPTVVVEWVLS